MNKILLAFCTLFLFTTVRSQTTAPEKPYYMQWSQLPALPGTPGLAGAFAGVSNGALLVAGGANFPDGGAPWTGSTKAWHDKVYALENVGSTWKEVGKLPRPLGYGVSASWRGGLICAGGSDAPGHFADVFMLTYAKWPNTNYCIAILAAAIGECLWYGDRRCAVHSGWVGHAIFCSGRESLLVA